MREISRQFLSPSCQRRLASRSRSDAAYGRGYSRLDSSLRWNDKHISFRFFQLRVIATAILALAFIILMLSVTAQAAAGPYGAHAAPMSKPLRVCADPNDLPFSNQAGQGFENHLAQMIATELGTTVDYTWWPQRRHFLRDTLDAGICDVVMALPTNSNQELTTNPYYRSTYALVYRKNAPYTLKSINDPLLKKLKIAVHAVGDDWADLPGGSVLAHRGIINNVVTYKLYADYSRPNPSEDVIAAVANGDVDVAVAWGPLAGYFATREPVKLKVVPIVHAQAILPFEFAISLAVRRDEPALRDKLNRILRRKHAAIHALLTRYGVPLLGLPTQRSSRLAENGGTTAGK